MSVIDDPKKWILKLFKMEGGTDAQRFENGIRSLNEIKGRGALSRLFGKRTANIPLEAEERIYGIYKDKYFFTPLSFIQRKGNGFERVRWNEIARCSSSHPLGVSEAVLTLVDGRTVNVKVGDMGNGWVGRISQLFLQLIEHHGANAAMGISPMTIEDFFDQALDDYSFLPNLEPHPSLAESRAAIEELSRLPEVKEIRLVLAENGPEGPIADGIVIRGDVDLDQLAHFIKAFGCDGVVEAEGGLRRHFPDLAVNEALLHLGWD